MKVAYLLNTYPQPSHSFIRRELRALETAGGEVLRIAMRRSQADLVDPQDQEEESKTVYVLETGVLKLLGSLLSVMAGSPARFQKALCLALRLGRKSEVGIVRHLIYLTEACYVKSLCKNVGIQHAHSHFGTNSTTVAMLCDAIGGPGFSFTVHGPEEFDAPRTLGLPEKLERCRFAVAISQFGRSQLCRWSKAENWAKIHVVHCGIDKRAFEKDAALPNGDFRMVTVGRFSEQKGQMVLIEAMARIQEQSQKVHLTMVGDGELRPEIEAGIKARGLGNCVSLVGWQSEDRVVEEIQQSHVLVLPSFAEGLPMVLMEAMAAERPVISTYVAGIPELVQHGKNGWLVPAGDVEALVEAIRVASAAPRETLINMGQAGRKRVWARHDIQTEAAKLAKAFKAVISGA